MTRNSSPTRSSEGFLRGLSRWSRLLFALALAVATACGDDEAGSPDGSFADADASTPDDDDAGEPTSADGGADGSVPADLPFYRSGTRLRAMVIDGAQAPAALDGFHDTELDVPCAFRTATDDRVRCLPTTGETYAPWPGLFTDAECTDPAIMQTAECDAPGPYHLVSQSGCQVRSAVHALSRVAAATSVYSKDFEGNCVEQEVGDGSVYRLGDALDPAMFVAAAVQNTAGSQLTRRVYLGEDGSLESASPADEALGGEGCELRRVDGALRCVPFARVYAEDWWYGANDCAAQTLAYGNKYEPSCLEPQIGIYPNFSSFVCGERTISLFRPGAQATGTAYDDSMGMCVATPIDDLVWSLYEVGEDVAAEELETVTTENVGSGRLQLRMHHALDGQPVAYARRDGALSYRDTSLELDCELTRTAAHGLRCVPAPAAHYYSDDGCTERVLALPAEECGAPPAAVSLIGVPNFVCDEPEALSQLEVLRVGAALPASTQAYAGEPGSCGPTEIPGMTRLFAAGEAIDITDLAELERRRE